MLLSELTSAISRMGWANKLTMIRIGAVIPILFLIHFPSVWTCWIAAVLFILAAITDFFDGYIARKEKQVTNFGKFLDPLADKLLICSILIEMSGLGWVPAWIVTIIIIRELAVTGLRAVAADKGVVIAADWYGKWKTGFQIMALIPLTIHYPVFGIPSAIIGSSILWIALILTIFSGCNYFINFYKEWQAGLASGRFGA